MLNDHLYDLHPHEEDIGRDAKLLKDYMNGFHHFLGGDTQHLQRQYFSLLNWMFLTPLLPPLRETAIQTDRKGFLYPALAVVYGNSSAGKTDFIRTVSLMMLGVSPLMPGSKFTATRYRSWAEQSHAFPLLVDDISGKRFHDQARDLIKQSDYWDQPGFPCVIFSANSDLKALDSEITKRIITIHVAASLPPELAIKDSLTRGVQQKIGTDFYRAYLAQCLPAIGEMMDQLRDDAQVLPDPFLFSSQLIGHLLDQYGDGCPEWASPIAHDEYIQMGGDKIREKLRQMLDSNPGMFSRDGRRDLLIIKTQDWSKTFRII